MATIIKRKTSYFVVYRVDGKQKWKLGGKRKKDAERLKTDIERQLHEGTYQDLPDITFEELSIRFLRAHAVHVREKTLESYRGHLTNKVAPILSTGS